jgi:cytochrome c oxidase subunit 2
VNGLMFVRVLDGDFDIHTDRALIHQLAAQHAGNGDQQTGETGDIQTPGPDERVRLAPAQQPVEGRQGQEHDCEGGVAPGGDQTADARHSDQIDQADKAGQPTAKSAHAAQPQACPRPEKIVGDEIGHIRADQRNQSRDRKMDQHGMDGVSAEGHSADDGFVFHKHSWSQSLIKTAGISGLLFLAGCSGPFSILDPAGPSAQAVAQLWWLMFSAFGLVFAIVVALWLYAVRRGPEPDDQRRNNAWIIGGGVLLPLVAITVLLAFGIPAGHRMLPVPTPENVLRIDVTGHQWWWEMRYPERNIRLRNELHIPVGTPVDIHLTTADVIHAFWVPRLGGKLDAIPGRTTILRLQAEQPGIYRGQCAEFCGLHHARMQFTVTAHEPAAFQQWLEETSGND